jgi:serine phosphatase RsbU (regulator of sigma subunit)/PAS domain-containing protein
MRPAAPRERLLGAVAVALAVAVVTWLLTRADADDAGLALAAVTYLLLVTVASAAYGLTGGLTAAVLAFLALSYHFSPPIGSFAVEDPEILFDLVIFVLVALVVSWLSASQSEARRRAERAAERTRRLQQLTSALAGAITEEDVRRLAVNEGATAAGASEGAIAVVGGEGATRVALRSGAHGPGPSGQDDGDVRPVMEEAARGGAVAIRGVDGGPGGEGAVWAAAPLRQRQRTLGAVAFRFPAGAQLGAEERELLTTIADQASQALERTRLLDTEHQSRAALALLADVSERVSATLDDEETLRAVAELAVGSVCDLCVVDLVQPDGRIGRLVVAAADDELQALAAPLAAHPPDAAGPHPVARVIRDGRSALFADIRPTLEAAIVDDEHQRVMRALDVASVMIAPLHARGRTLGAISFSRRRGGRRYDATDLALAEDVGRRAALALDNARLYGEAETDRRRLDRVLQRLPVGVLIADAPSGRIAAANRQASAIWRRPVTAEGLDDYGGYEAFHADGRPYEIGDWPLARTLATGEPIDNEEIAVRFGDGSAGVISVSCAPVEDADGEVRSIVVTIFDLTEVRRSEETARFLADASELLSASLDVDETLARLATLAVPRLGDWCSIDLLEHGRIRNAGVAHVDPDKVRLARDLQRRFPPDPAAPTGSAAVIRTGRSDYLREISDELLDAVIPDPELLEIIRALGLRSSVVAPLTARGRTFGARSVIAAESGRLFSEDDRALVEDLAHRAALAIDNARLYRDQRKIAQTLQQGLLPTRLPELPGVAVAAVYRPAGEGADVGGDFYDLWEVPDGSFGVAVGDVCGKGAEAAALTALTRHTLRTASMHEPTPTRVLRVLNRAILQRDGSGRFCTVAYAWGQRVEDGFRVTICCGGHPLPCVLRADGRVERVGATGTLLGIHEDVELHDRQVELAVGDTLVLWTDGVSERRGGGELFGEARLEQLLEAQRGSSAAEIVAAIERAVVDFAPGLPQDDIAVVAVRAEPSSTSGGAVAVAGVGEAAR